MSNTAQIVEKLYALWKAHDLEAAKALLADDFCFIIKVPSDVHPLGGACHGRETAMARLGAILAGFEMLDYAVGPLMVNGEQAAAETHVHYRDRATGEDLKATMGHFWTLRDGKAVRLMEYHDIDTLRDFAARVALH